MIDNQLQADLESITITLRQLTTNYIHPETIYNQFQVIYNQLQSPWDDWQPITTRFTINYNHPETIDNQLQPDI